MTQELFNFKYLAKLFFPNVCLHCGWQLTRTEQYLCIPCTSKLEHTGFHENPHENSLVRRFWGRLPLEGALAYWIYRKSSGVRNIIHAFKYHNQPQVAAHYTTEYAQKYLSSTNFMKTVDWVLPIPIHHTRKQQRGYNQSSFIAEALSQQFQLQWSDELLERSTATQTQTRKGSFDRWDNVQTIFRVAKPELLKNKHILLVDDVITTGSTIESCGKVIIDTVAGARLSILGLASRL